MAEKKVLVNLNFNGNQIIDVRAEVAASAPASASPGRFYFNTTYQKLYIYTTNGWKVVGDDLPANIVTGSGLTANKVVLGVDGSGKIKTSSFEINKTVPSDAVFTDQNVKQEAAPSTNNNYEFPVLFSKIEWNNGAARTGGNYFSQYMKYNPSTDRLTVKNLAATDAITINGNAVATEDYVNAQDAKINDRISSISGFGRYLSGWDMATGEPTSLPTTASYTLQSGDYFVISNVPSSGTKYKPSQTGTWQTSQQFAHTATSESCVVGGYWKYDGSTWSYFAPESAVSLPAFTNSSRGGLVGLQSSGYVYHDPSDAEGRAKVYGWANKADTTTSHTITISGDATGSGNHTNASGSNATISVTIADGAVTSIKIADGAVTEDKIAGNAVTYQKIAAKAIGIAILAAASQDYPEQPYWQATGNANEYKATITSVTRNGTVRLCEATGNSFNGAKEVDCVYQYNEDETGIYSCTVYINSSAAPASYAYGFLCRKEN